MKNTELIGKHIETKLGNLSGECVMCGEYTSHGFKKKDYIKDARFTNFDLLKKIKSDIICESCAACLKNSDLRRKSFVASEQSLEFVNNNDLENVLFDLKYNVTGEFIVCVTKSFKKHNSFRATVNKNTSKYYIQFEDDVICFDVNKLQAVYKKLKYAYDFFSKDELLSGKYYLHNLKKYLSDHEMSEFNDFENILKKNRGSSEYNFLIFILRKAAKNE